MAQLPNRLIMDIIKMSKGAKDVHKLNFAGVLESIKAPHKFHEDFDGEYFGHLKGTFEEFWIDNLYVEDPLELEQMSNCGLYEVLAENYIDEDSIIGLWC
tara:strand:+ start:457 stop:756 length:300 start_codon:yes stop_codon:yes gene_type:complete